ncbi:hypothetical protein DY000_02015306 [Brassica cretica]|uniref:Uncharacterized protein n=1 Tax=Brassica cretica TaxID=69181 RepID=A0ABQ7CSN3_BRACR|nr:hypothetical protein DY000_02015306 [Brassica cretica]
MCVQPGAESVPACEPAEAADSIFQAAPATTNNSHDELKNLTLLCSNCSKASKFSEKKRTKHPAGSKMIASSEHVETPPPRHLMNPISTEQLARFRKMVRRLPKKISFEHA